MKQCQQQKISLIIAIKAKNTVLDCGLNFKPVKAYDGLRSRTTALILNTVYQQF